MKVCILHNQIKFNASRIAVFVVLTLLSSTSLSKPNSKKKCSGCHNSNNNVEEMVVTGYQPLRNRDVFDWDFGYASNFFTPPSVPNAEELRRQEEERRERERKKCIDEAKDVGKKCETTYGGTGNWLCYTTAAIFGRFGFLRVPDPFKFTYTIGASAGSRASCESLKKDALAWCVSQTQASIARCN